MDVIHQQFEVAYEYPVYFTRGLFAESNPMLSDFLGSACESHCGIMVCIDRGVARAWPHLAGSIENYLTARPRQFKLVAPALLVAGGEAAKKDWCEVRRIIGLAAERQVCRHSYLLAVGGGSMLDVAGLAASLIHRGIRLLRVPTTVLAQCDGGVGVKNGIDHGGVKNFLGTFAPPSAVFNDFDFLATLPAVYWHGGVAEAFKVAIIKDAGLFATLTAEADALRRCELAAVAPVIERTAALHLDHIRRGGDPFEFGSARPLDFGHWSAHKLETLSDYRIGHGLAVAVGIAIDTCYAAVRGLLSEAQRDQILEAMRRAGLPLWSPLLRQTDGAGEPSILAGLEEFRQHLGGRLTITLPCGIGDRQEVHEVNRSDLLAALDFLSHSYSDCTP